MGSKIARAKPRIWGAPVLRPVSFSSVLLTLYCFRMAQCVQAKVARAVPAQHVHIESAEIYALFYATSTQRRRGYAVTW